MGRSAEAFEALEALTQQQMDQEMEYMYANRDKDVVVAVTLRTEDDLFNMMVAMNEARAEEYRK